MIKKEKVQQELAREIMICRFATCYSLKRNAEDTAKKNSDNPALRENCRQIVCLMETLIFWMNVLFGDPLFEDAEWVNEHADLIPDPVDILRDCTLYRNKYHEEIMDLATAFAVLGIVEKVDKRIHEGSVRGEIDFTADTLVRGLSDVLSQRNDYKESDYAVEVSGAAIVALKEKLALNMQKKGPQADLKHRITYANKNLRRLKLDSEMRRKQILSRACYICDWIDEATRSRVISKLEADVISSRYFTLTMQPDGLYALPSWRTVGRRIGLTSSAAKRIHDNAIDKLVNAADEGKIRALHF